MLKLIKDDTFTREVSIPLPDGVGTTMMRAAFAFKSQAELTAIFKADKGDAGLLDDVLVGWADFNDYEGSPIEFSAENKADAIGMPFLRNALAVAYMQAVNGTRIKN